MKVLEEKHAVQTQPPRSVRGCAWASQPVSLPEDSGGRGVAAESRVVSGFPLGSWVLALQSLSVSRHVWESPRSRGGSALVLLRPSGGRGLLAASCVTSLPLRARVWEKEGGSQWGPRCPRHVPCRGLHQRAGQGTASNGHSPGKGLCARTASAASHGPQAP